MRHIVLKAIAFTYGCVGEHSANRAMLIETVRHFTEHTKARLIIINDRFPATISDMVDNLHLAPHSKVLVCANTAHGSEILDLETGSRFNLGGPLSSDSLLSAVQRQYQLPREATVTVGENEAHIGLGNSALLHFHVGPASVLGRKTRNLVPLTDQFESGLNNVLLYFLRSDLEDDPIEYLDLVHFVGKARAFFGRRDAAQLLLRKHIDCSRTLAGHFPEEIAAIFGSGFPFYVSSDPSSCEFESTPDSILRYLDTQLDYFKAKIMDETIFCQNADIVFGVEELEVKLKVVARRNTFDIYEYEKMNHPSPSLSSGCMRLSEYYANTCFEVSSDIWPCYYCATLQSDDQYPWQNVLKNSNVTCLPCKQTAFMLRNIMGCTPDIDLLVVVRDGKQRQAGRIKDFIRKQSPFYLYDADFRRTVIDNDGPVDLFITESADLMAAYHQLLDGHWWDVVLNCMALWSPTVELSAQFGMNFPLAFEPLVASQTSILDELANTRKGFAELYSPQSVVAKLRKSSFYTEQLMGNPEIIDIMERRLSNWCASLRKPVPLSEVQ